MILARQDPVGFYLENILPYKSKPKVKKNLSIQINESLRKRHSVSCLILKHSGSINYKYTWSVSLMPARDTSYAFYIKPCRFLSATSGQPFPLIKYAAEVFPVFHPLNIISAPLLEKIK